MSQPSLTADRWFLNRGLPAVVRRPVLLRQVWSRSAPALAALAVFAANSVAIVGISGQHTVDIAGRPDLREGFVLGLLVLLVPVAALTGWLVSRIEAPRRRSVVSTLCLAVIVAGAVFGGPSTRILPNLMVFGSAVAVVVLLTATGVGAILAWVAELTGSNLTATAGMFIRALPVVLLTFLVFFNTYVWLMTSLISRGRLWLGMGFLFLVAGSFLVSTTLDQVKPLLSSPACATADDNDLAGTPFEGIPNPVAAENLSAAERLNIVFVVAASQLVHVLTVAVMTGAVFFILGMILVSPPVLDAWTRGNGRLDGEVLGMTLPIPDSLIQTTMLLTAITFMYVSAKAVTDAQYRAQFLDPMLEDIRVTLSARNRYRSA
jgi:hypothetical protein